MASVPTSRTRFASTKTSSTRSASARSSSGPSILIVADAGYDVTRLAFVLADLPVEGGRQDPLRSRDAAAFTSPRARRHRASTQSTAACSPWPSPTVETLPNTPPITTPP